MLSKFLALLFASYALANNSSSSSAADDSSSSSDAGAGGGSSSNTTGAGAGGNGGGSSSNTTGAGPNNNNNGGGANATTTAAPTTTAAASGNATTTVAATTTGASGEATTTAAAAATTTMAAGNATNETTTDASISLAMTTKYSVNLTDKMVATLQMNVYALGERHAVKGATASVCPTMPVCTTAGSANAVGCCFSRAEPSLTGGSLPTGCAYDAATTLYTYTARRQLSADRRGLTATELTISSTPMVHKKATAADRTAINAVTLTAAQATTALKASMDSVAQAIITGTPAALAALGLGTLSSTAVGGNAAVTDFSTLSAAATEAKTNAANLEVTGVTVSADDGTSSTSSAVTAALSGAAIFVAFLF